MRGGERGQVRMITNVGMQMTTIKSTLLNRRHHPNHTIYVLLTSPLLRLSGAVAAVAALGSTNVNFKHVNFESFLSGSPLEQLWTQGRVQKSKFVVSHASDVLRFVQAVRLSLNV